MLHRTALSTTCCISNQRLFDDGTASEYGDVSLSVVAVVLVVLYWCSIFDVNYQDKVKSNLDFGYVLWGPPRGSDSRFHDGFLF